MAPPPSGTCHDSTHRQHPGAGDGVAGSSRSHAGRGDRGSGRMLMVTRTRSGLKAWVRREGPT